MHYNRKLIRFVWILIFAGLVGSSLSASANELNIDKNGLYIKGYDPVSYHDKRPAKGLDKYSLTYQGATIHFSSEQNRKKFSENPEEYIPGFGGYCSYGVRNGKKLNIDPMTYAIVDGKLYLHLNRATKVLWDKERQRNINIANIVWNEIRSIPAEVLKTP